MRGAGKHMFSKNIADLCSLYQLEILAIFEPRISDSKASRVIRKLGFSNSFVMDAEGFSRGIWLLWNNSKIKLHVVAHSRHSIAALVKDHNTIWIITVVYANPCLTTRRHLWNYLDSITNCFDFPWMVAGDFNDITYNSEKRGVIRCRRNKLEGFKKEDGSWTGEIELMKKEVVGQFLPDIVSPNQAAFVPSRQIQDNIVVVHEVLHKFKNAKRNLGFIAKIDLAKAYDNLQWGFIKQVLEMIGIEGRMKDLIMSYVSSVQYR
ncbi:hypothetical protein Ddye_025543 [Dipteronia dyeriana]|uniref:Reverse transcriptase domain-containing protein n=1 Tax=Dipteronia dyeriana TaxID=168575 RepID=A0AAD9TLD7_9ROSI|nr:hypothetical protein Ddye_025543 [Dipteronia dyeriana]